MLHELQTLLGCSEFYFDAGVYTVCVYVQTYVYKVIEQPSPQLISLYILQFLLDCSPDFYSAVFIFSLTYCFIPFGLNCIRSILFQTCLKPWFAMWFTTDFEQVGELVYTINLSKVGLQM